MLVSVTVSLETTVSKTTTNATSKFLEAFTKTVQITTAQTARPQKVELLDRRQGTFQSYLQLQRSSFPTPPNRAALFLRS